MINSAAKLQSKPQSNLRPKSNGDRADDYDGYRERQHMRIPFERPVTLVAANVGKIGSAVIENISPGGALLRLDTKEWVHLPLYFFVTLTPDGSVRRMCELVWRENRKVGVKFLIPKAKKPKQNLEKKVQRVPKLFISVK